MCSDICCLKGYNADASAFFIIFGHLAKQRNVVVLNTRMILFILCLVWHHAEFHEGATRTNTLGLVQLVSRLIMKRHSISGSLSKIVSPMWRPPRHLSCFPHLAVGVPELCLKHPLLTSKSSGSLISSFVLRTESLPLLCELQTFCMGFYHLQCSMCPLLGPASEKASVA